MRDGLTRTGSASVALVVLGCMSACDRGAGLTAEDAGAPPAASARLVVDASTLHPATLLTPPGAPRHSEFSAYLAATSTHAIAMKQLGEQVLVLASGGPYEARHDGELVKSALGAKLTAHSPGDLAGTWPDDLWALDAEESHGERTHVFYYVSHWESGAWNHIKVTTELSDMAGDWFDGFTPTAPGTAVAFTHGHVDGDAGQPDDDDVITTITPDGGSAARGVGALIGSDGTQAGVLLGTLSGDAFIATGDHLIRIPPGGRELAISPPSLGASGDAGDAGAPGVEITTMALAGKAAVVVGLHRGRHAAVKAPPTEGGAPEKSAIALFKGETKWETHECPFDEPIASLVATPDGAVWAVTKGNHVWRYEREWKELEILPSDLEETKLTKSPDVALVATAADDAWLSFTRGPSAALFHTKPTKEVRRFGAPKPAPAKAR